MSILKDCEDSSGSPTPIFYYQFSSVQLLSRVRLFATP